MKLFKDRQDAGRQLALKLKTYAKQKDALVLALPRGGVPVAYEVAKALKLPLDVLIVRKLGVPGHQELAMGAIASGGVRVLNDDIIKHLNIPEHMIDAVAAEESLELERREQRYRSARPTLNVKDKTVIVVDDGVATGATMRAAVSALKQLSPKKLIVAAPTAAGDTCAELRQNVDEVVCLATPEPYVAVGVWYEHFGQINDMEVKSLLKEIESFRFAKVTAMKQGSYG